MPTVYVTAPEEAAEDLARGLVEERLAACVNAIPCRSWYRWEGDVVEDDEVALVCKTTDARYPELRARIVERHPYDVPAIERFDEVDVDEAYARWVAEGTTRAEGAKDNS
ncbi:MAG: divalent-cation tolerance protein CutA [Halobacteriales archaeon]